MTACRCSRCLHRRYLQAALRAAATALLVLAAAVAVVTLGLALGNLLSVSPPPPA